MQNNTLLPEMKQQVWRCWNRSCYKCTYWPATNLKS